MCAGSISADAPLSVTSPWAPTPPPAQPAPVTSHFRDFFNPAPMTDFSPTRNYVNPMRICSKTRRNAWTGRRNVKIRRHVDSAELRAGRLAHRSEEHTSELQSRQYLVCRLLLEK